MTPKLASIPEDQEVDSVIQTSSSVKIAQTRQIVNHNGVGDQILADAPAQQTPTAQESFNQSFNRLKSKFFTPIETDVKLDANKKFKETMGPIDLMMMRHNPLASPAAKKESELFRVQAFKEFSSENVNFYDDAYKMMHTPPTSPKFDQQISSLCEKYVPRDAEQSANLSDVNRNATWKAFQGFKQAQNTYETSRNPQNQESLIQARTELLGALANSTKDINERLQDTSARFFHGDLRADIHNQGKFSLFGLAQKNYKEALLQNSKAGSIRLDNYRANGKVYSDYRKKYTAEGRAAVRQDQRVAQASGAPAGTLKHGLYKTFIHPFKFW